METSLIYEPKDVKVSATLHRYDNRDPILALRLHDTTSYQGGQLTIQGSEKDMRKLLTVLGRVLRHPEVSEILKSDPE